MKTFKINKKILWFGSGILILVLIALFWHFTRIGKLVLKESTLEPFYEISDKYGGGIEFYKHEDETFEVMVKTKFPNPPMLTDEFVESHSIAAIYVAIAPLNAEIPKEILQDTILNRPGADWASDSLTRLKLKSELQNQLASFPKFVIDQSTTAAPAPGCSPFFRNWVNSVYGSNCGQVSEGPFASGGSVTYCNSGCTYPIFFFGGGGDCNNAYSGCGDHPFTGNYSRVYGRYLNFHGNGSFLHTGFRSHFGVANCNGSGSHDGDSRFRRRYGDGDWITKWVPEGYFYHYYSGPTLRYYGAGFSISYGNWAHAPSQRWHRMQWDYNTADGDLIIACQDIYGNATFTPPPSWACGGCSWCYPDSPCNGCFSTYGCNQQ